MQTQTVQARDELFVCSEVFRKIDTSEEILPSEAVIAANTLPAIASFLTLADDGGDFKRVAKHLRAVATTCARLAIKNGNAALITTYGGA